MRKILVLIVTLTLLASCSLASKQENYHKISASEAKDMMDNQEVIIVDVRTEKEYVAGHIEDAILLPNESIDKTKPEELKDQEAVILVYCRSGNRSKQAANKLLEMGYQNIYDFGGINDWPYDITK